MINDPEVFCLLKMKTKRIQIYIYKNGNYYVLDAGQIPSGTYRYHASTMYKGQSLVFDGNFLLKPSNWKPMTLQQGNDVLKALSDKSNGKMYVINQLNQLAEDLIKNPSLKPSIFYYTLKSHHSLQVVVFYHPFAFEWRMVYAKVFWQLLINHYFARRNNASRVSDKVVQVAHYF